MPHSWQVNSHVVVNSIANILCQNESFCAFKIWLEFIKASLSSLERKPPCLWCNENFDACVFKWNASKIFWARRIVLYVWTNVYGVDSICGNPKLLGSRPISENPRRPWQGQRSIEASTGCWIRHELFSPTRIIWRASVDLPWIA